MQVRRSEPDGRTFGPVRSLEPPFGLTAGDRRGGDWVLGAADGRLVVGFSVRGLSTDPGSAWYTTLR